MMSQTYYVSWKCWLISTDDEPNVLRILEMLPKKMKITLNVWDYRIYLFSFLIYMGAAILDCMTSLRTWIEQPTT